MKIEIHYLVAHITEETEDGYNLLTKNSQIIFIPKNMGGKRIVVSEGDRILVVCEPQKGDRVILTLHAFALTDNEYIANIAFKNFTNGMEHYCATKAAYAEDVAAVVISILLIPIFGLGLVLLPPVFILLIKHLVKDYPEYKEVLDVYHKIRNLNKKEEIASYLKEFQGKSDISADFSFEELKKSSADDNQQA